MIRSRCGWLSDGEGEVFRYIYILGIVRGEVVAQRWGLGIGVAEKEGEVMLHSLL